MEYHPNKNGMYYPNQAEKDSITIADAIICGVAAVCFAVGGYGLAVMLFCF